MPSTGLFQLFIGDQFWTFYEWAPGLDFKNGHSFGDDGKFRLDAPHNLYLIEAFDAVADLLGYEGRETEAAVVAQTCWQVASGREACISGMNAGDCSLRLAIAGGGGITVRRHRRLQS